jgi:hypothetical protein
MTTVKLRIGRNFSQASEIYRGTSRNFANKSWQRCSSTMRLRWYSKGTTGGGGGRGFLAGFPLQCFEYSQDGVSKNSWGWLWCGEWKNCQKIIVFQTIMCTVRNVNEKKTWLAIFCCCWNNSVVVDSCKSLTSLCPWREKWFFQIAIAIKGEFYNFGTRVAVC